ncbi:MAG: ProQ/FinO family protein [Oceanospirillaceae bacterium]|nr:ProQ/FinO family protein [Oceanospirillaceae bacterium]
MQQSESNKVNDAANSDSGKAKSKSKNRAANQAAVQLLIETYPQTFSRNQVRPLKIGIQEDLLADDKVSKNKVKRALASYVRSLAYYRSLQAGADRVDLQGAAAGQVTEAEAEHAKGKLKELNRQRRERDKQRRQEEREREKSDRLNNKLEQLMQLNKR